MQIIDAQIHLWNTGTVVPPHRTRPYLLNEALGDMDAAGVDGAIIHPPSWDPESHGLAITAARLHPQRFAILGRIPLDQPEKRSQIETWREQPGMLAQLSGLGRSAKPKPLISQGSSCKGLHYEAGSGSGADAVIFGGGCSGRTSFSSPSSSLRSLSGSV
jgi:hypothetical protein